MIRSVRIKGFQSLADVELVLGRFTVIQGRSNSGKSAVVRALRAVMTNAGNLRGTGGSFIHTGSKSCTVEIRRDEGDLTWVKSEKKTTYELGGRKFQTGTEVPPEVADSLKLGDIVLDADNKFNVNFQGGARNEGQFESPFLVVGKPGSYLAKVFALLTSANVLYSAQAVAKKDVREKAGRLKTLRSVVEADKARLVDMQTQHAALHAASTAATEQWACVLHTDAERVRLSDTLAQLRAIDAEVLSCEQQLAAMGAVDESMLAPAEATMAQLQSLRTYRDALAALDVELRTVESQLSTLPDGIDALAEAAAAQAATIASFRSYQSALAAVDTELATVDASIAAETAAAAAATEELLALVEQIGTCPTCNQVMNRELVLA